MPDGPISATAVSAEHLYQPGLLATTRSLGERRHNVRERRVRHFDRWCEHATQRKGLHQGWLNNCFNSLGLSERSHG